MRIVTLSAVCVIVNSNGFACPLFGFCGRHVPDRFGGDCAARPITTTAATSTTVNIARFMSSSFSAAMLHRIVARLRRAGVRWSWHNRRPRRLAREGKWRKQRLPAPADKVALYERLVATNPRVERKGATMPYTSLNGNMFSFVMKSGRVGLRLPAAEREAFIKKYKTKLVEQYGVVQKEYVEVPDALLAKTTELKRYSDASFEYVSSLKPKPTTKSKK